MDPRKGECLGFYLYGSGWFAREDQQMGILRAERTEASFCNECALKGQCEREHGLRIRAEHPADVEVFEREVALGERRGFSRVLVAAARARAGNPDPYMAAALANYKRGVSDRDRSPDL